LHNVLAAIPPLPLDDEEAAISTVDTVAAMEEPDNKSGVEDSKNHAGVAGADEVQVGASVDHAMEEGCDGDAEGDFSVSSIPEKRKTREQPGVQAMPAPMSATKREPARAAARGRTRERPGDEDRPQNVRHRRQPGASAIGKAPVAEDHPPEPRRLTHEHTSPAPHTAHDRHAPPKKRPATPVPPATLNPPPRSPVCPRPPLPETYPCQRLPP